MIQPHFQLTGDRQWFRRMWPRVVREVNQIIRYRNVTRYDPKKAELSSASAKHHPKDLEVGCGD